MSENVREGQTYKFYVLLLDIIHNILYRIGHFLILSPKKAAFTAAETGLVQN